MNSEALQNLPPEMQARLAQIMTQAQQQPGSPVAPAPQPQAQAPAPIVKPPSLMDHLIALRQEVGAMRQEIANMSAQVEANSSVVEAVGQATGTIYQMFQQTSNPSSTYSESFQQQSQVDDGNDY